MVEHMDPDLILPIYAFIAVAFLVLSFVVILCVRTVPNKLLLLGFLVAVTGIGFGAFLPGMATAAVVLLILAVICILAGIICILVSHIVKSIKSCNETKPES